MDQNSGDPIYDLLMPFVVCKTQGGPYEDDAFVAGFRLGVLDAQMSLHRTVKPVYLSPADTRQLDLMAMRYEYELAVEDYDDEWCLCTLKNMRRP